MAQVKRKQQPYKRLQESSLHDVRIIYRPAIKNDSSAIPRRKDGVKRNLKRGETKPFFDEMRASVFEGLCFMFLRGFS